jgi:type VI secretion system protein ImpG
MPRKRTKQTFWLAHRRPSSKKNDEGTELSISLVDLSARPVYPDIDTLTLRTTCTNRDLPSRLTFASETGDFEIEGGAAIKRIVALRKPTSAVRPPSGKLPYALISHLCSTIFRWSMKDAKRFRRFSSSTTSPAPRILKNKSTHPGSPAPATRPADFRKRNHLRARHPCRAGTDEEMFTGGGVFLFSASSTLPGSTCPEQLQPACHSHETKKGARKRMAPEPPNNLDVDCPARLLARRCCSARPRARIDIRVDIWL